MKKLFLLCFLFFSLACFSQEENAEKIYIANHPAIPEIMKEFVDGCKYYNINYKQKLHEIDAIRVVPGETNFLGRVQGNTIEVNEELIHYPNLFRVVLLRQIGKWYGLKKEKTTKLYIMSERWEITPQYELWAYNNRTLPTQRRQFFELLQEENFLDKEI